MSPWYTSANARRPHATPSVKPARKIPPRLRGFGLLVFALVIASTVGYLVQTNALATDGYRIEKLQRQVQGLKSETRDLERAVLEQQSFETIARRIRRLDLVPAGKPEYLADVKPVAANR